MRGRKNATAIAGGSTFPGYANVAELASGAFATVYRAVELGTGRPVALKVLRVADASPHLLEVFEKELGALALLSNHPNVTTLYGTFFTPEGRPVLVLELCRESLAHRARQSGPLSAGEVVQVGIKIAGALETAHRSGLLHRDMKPQNILVSQFDEPVLADFGVATLQAQAQSTEGVFGFTTLHAPPEALEGLPLSPSSDIYGLASSMYQLLVGRGPFSSYEGEAPASVILRILRDPAPRAPANDIPVALADLIENALAKDPSKRPQTAGAFAEALRDIESLAGWSQTPYVVWGASQAAPGRAEDEVPAPAAPAPAAERLSQLLHAERATLDRLHDPATQVAPAAPAPVRPAPQVPPAAAARPPGHAAGSPAQPAGAPAKAAGKPSKTRHPSPPSPKLAPQEPAPPGTRSVIAPEPQERNVLTPLPASAKVRVIAPAEPVTPVSSWLTALPGTQGAAWGRQWPLSPVPTAASGPAQPQPSATRPLSSPGQGLDAGRGAPRRKEARVFVGALVAAVVLVGGLGWAALAHLL
ncbi:MAG TPA: serine/threonine-protein kinase [Acidimicrobiales bacterium]|nr:serine/threonine-protein kinase [Acidimicrobiales bacterium]